MLGRFEIRRELARGGMGVVYEAFDPMRGRPIALKVMLGTNSSSLQRFEREAKLAGQLRHPNIITIREIGEVDGAHFIAMDLVLGPTLEDALPELSLAQGIDILEQVADAIGYAHGQGVLHRDLKPANVLLAGPRPIVTDFGLARSDADRTVTEAGTVLGTPQYMAPEQVRGCTDQIDTRSDTWALGVMLYQLISGRLPFRGRTTEDLYDAIIAEDPTFWFKAPAALKAICRKALDKDRERRYPHGQALADELHRWHEGVPVRAAPIGRLYELKLQLRRRFLLLTVCLTLAILALIVAIMLGR